MLNDKQKRFLLEHKKAVVLLLLATLAALYFAGKIVSDIIYFNDPKHRDQDLKNWMTPHYVVMSYQLPRPLVSEIFQLEENKGKRRNMRYIAERLDMSLEELTALVRQSAEEYRDKGE